MASKIKNPILGVGIIGCGEITQVAHISTLAFLSDLFKVTYLCDVSDGALRHCQRKIIGHVPKTTRDPVQLCSSPDVDVVLVVNSDEYHTVHTVLALQHNKHVFVEKPMALNQRDADVIIEAEKLSHAKVMVGYMRRYAAGFVDALTEIGGMDKITYARVRGMLIYYNSHIS
jgi:predicted dehydrogenase